MKSNLPEQVQSTPWSYVARFLTTDGYIYLKHTPKLLAWEATIFQILRDQFHAPVPKVIAHNPKLNCFLMNDAGNPLREMLTRAFDDILVCKTIDQFTSLQLTVADHIDVFLDISVPDWRLDKLPNLYHQLVSQKDLLIADGLSELDIRNLEALLPRVSNLCKKLSQYSIKQTLVQPDFNDNNTLIDPLSHKVTLIDLGEIAISHPFFSLLNFLHQIKKHHALPEDDSRYLRIKDSCLKNYMKFESKKSLLDAFSTARLLFFVYSALSSYRLKLACDSAKFTLSFQRHGNLSFPLKEFMNVCMV